MAAHPMPNSSNAKNVPTDTAATPTTIPIATRSSTRRRSDIAYVSSVPTNTIAAANARLISTRRPVHGGSVAAENARRNGPLTNVGRHQCQRDGEPGLGAERGDRATRLHGRARLADHVGTEVYTGGVDVVDHEDEPPQGRRIL